MSKVSEITSETEFDSVLASNEQVVVKFWATWCGPCRKFAPHFEAAAARSDATFVAVDIESVPSVAARYNVMTIPHVLEVAHNEVRVLESRTSPKLLAELN